MTMIMKTLMKCQRQGHLYLVNPYPRAHPLHASTHCLLFGRPLHTYGLYADKRDKGDFKKAYVKIILTLNRVSKHLAELPHEA